MARKVVAGLVMALAIAGMLAGLAGVAAVWAAKARWSRDAVAALSRVELDLEVGDAALREVSSDLAAARDGLDAISLTANGAADKLGTPRLVELTQTVQGNLSQIDGKVQEVNARLTQVEEGVNNIVTLANKLPGLEVPALDVKLLDGVSGLLSDADGRLQHLADEVTGGKVTVTQEMTGIGEGVERVRDSLDTVDATVSEAGARFAASRDALRVWAEKLPAMFQQAAVMLTAGLLWFVAGQIGLFMWMWSVYHSARRSD